MLTTKATVHVGWRLTLSLCVFVLSLAGCVTRNVQPRPAQQVARSNLLVFIQDRVTTREEVLLRLGTPSAQFEEQRILTYQIRYDENGQAQLFWPRRVELDSLRTNWDAAIFSLVLVFGPSGVLERHALVGAK